MSEKPKILVVDDNVDFCQNMADILELKGYEVVTAYDGAKALELVKQSDFDVVLMDIMMPNIDGYTACNIIKKNQATTAVPVIMLTGVRHELNKKLAEKIGADGYITKPVATDLLFRMVERILME